ncbi:MAG TPA: hypothetical protein VGL66_08525 [Caulobacteraceae bacterium]|jgi:hypothetical protein
MKRLASTLIGALAVLALASAAGASFSEPRENAEQAAAAEYEGAKAKAADGSRAYRWWSVEVARDPKGDLTSAGANIYLLVDRDGDGTLIDLDGHRFTVFPEEVAAFERLVRRAGFPHFLPAGWLPSPCFDGADAFEATIHGRHAQIMGCRSYPPRVQSAINALFALVRTHGGRAP